MTSRFLPKLHLTATSLLTLIFSGGAFAQSLTIVAGNGQIGAPNTILAQNLTVKLVDGANVPIANAGITFTTFSNSNAPFSGILSSNAATTGADGTANVTFTGAALTGFTLGFSQTFVTASYANLATTFTETTSNYLPNSSSLAVIAVLTSPTGGQPLTGLAGTAGTTPIKVAVGVPATGSTPVQLVPNVAVTFTSSSTNTTITCKEGSTVLTDSSGVATCTPIFGGSGNGTFDINVGGAIILPSNFFSVTSGPPAAITITGGNNQTVSPGSVYPLPVVAVVSDAAGTPLANIPITFTVTPAGSATLINTRAATDANGRVSTSVVAGPNGGVFTIKVADTAGLITTPALYTENITVNITGLTKVSGDLQTAVVNAAFGQPLIVQTSSSGPSSGVTVQFAVTSGAATLNPSAATTDSNGRASTSVTAGASAGAIVVTATSNGFTQTFNLTSVPPGPSNITFFNGASNRQGSPSPGSIVTVTGQGLVGSSVQGVLSSSGFGPLPYQLGGVTITIGGLPAPLFNVQNVNGSQSVTFQVPFEVPPGNTTAVIAASGLSASVSVLIVPLSPGIFQVVQSDNATRALALRANGTVVGPGNPASRGENVRIFLTGLGPVTPLVGTGSFSPYEGTDPVLTAAVVAGLNNQGIPVIQTIYARNLIGVYEMTIQVPADTIGFPSGSAVLSVGIQGPSGYVYSNASALLIQ